MKKYKIKEKTKSLKFIWNWLLERDIGFTTGVDYCIAEMSEFFAKQLDNIAIIEEIHDRK